jgi:hypothetical protein
MGGQTIALVRCSDDRVPGPGLYSVAPAFDELVLGYIEGEPERLPEGAAA